MREMYHVYTEKELSWK